MTRISDLFWGLALVVVVAVVSLWAGEFTQLGAVITSLAFGLILGNSIRRQERLLPGIQFSEKYLLETSIVLLGFSLNFSYLSKYSLWLWLIVGLSVLIVISLSTWLSSRLGLSKNLGLLLGAGSAICGTAAIAAISPLLRSEESETGVSIGVINLLGTLGLFFLPAMLLVMDYDAEQAGFLLGGVLQSVGHVTGAAFTLGDETGKLALVYKMGRILWLIPVILVIYFTNRSGGKDGRLIRFPLFIVFFLVAVSLAQWQLIPVSWKETLVQVGDFLLIVAMAAIGFKIKLRPLFNIARPALLAGTGIFVVQILMFWLILSLRNL